MRLRLLANGLLVFVCGLPTATAQIVFPDNDAWVSELFPEETFNDGRLNTRFGTLERPRNDAVYLRFNTSFFKRRDPTKAWLRLIRHRHLSGGGDVLLYGLNDGTPGDRSDGWDESTLTFANAPAHFDDQLPFDDPDIDASRTTFLGGFALPASEGVADVFSSDELVEFLGQDTNGLVTLVLAREFPSNIQDRWASKEESELDGGFPFGELGDFAPSLQVVLPPPQLTLNIDPEDGTGWIVNESGTDFQLDYYEIRSAWGGLNPADWESLQDQDLDAFPAGDGSGNGWEEFQRVDEYFLGEAFLQQGSTFEKRMIPIRLGAIFEPTAPEDLIFQFGLTSGEARLGLVRYASPVVLAADFDSNGFTDGNDLSAWQGGFGALLPQNSAAGGDADRDGDIDGHDFLIWQREFASGPGVPAAHASVPEPQTLLMSLPLLVLMLARSAADRASALRNVVVRPAAKVQLSRASRDTGPKRRFGARLTSTVPVARVRRAARLHVRQVFLAASQALVISLLCVEPCMSAKLDQLPAFPGALGQGALASGGRGGDVYHVTNLADYGIGEPPIPGSLRHGIQSATGPRTIVFDVAGALGLKRLLQINKSDLTLAGQTSPGGVTIYGYNSEIKGQGDTFNERFGKAGGAVDNLIVRYLRFRTGDFNGLTINADGSPTVPVSGKGNMDLPADGADGLSVMKASNIIVDHISASWGMDEVLSVTRSRNVTIQHSIIAEGLNDSFHPKGEHGHGSLIRGEVSPEEQETGMAGYTFFGNLYAHNRLRNPALGGQHLLDPGQTEEQRRALNLNFVNNVLYNWGTHPGHNVAIGETRLNYLANYIVAGPSTEADLREQVLRVTPGDTWVFQEGNFSDSDQDGLHDGEMIDTQAEARLAFVGFGEEEINYDGEKEPFGFFRFVEDHLLSAEAAYERVIRSAGASLQRDQIDRRIIRDLVDRTGQIIDSPDELRSSTGILLGIDDLPQRRRADDFDVDRDGMSDVFERIFGLDPDKDEDRNDTTLSEVGYTNLEVYLNALTGIRPAGDLDLDGDVDAEDWARFRTNYENPLLDQATLEVEAYLLGDLTGDWSHTYDDFLAFKASYNAVHGPGSLASLLSIPEPATAVIVLFCSICYVCVGKRWRACTN